MPSLRLSFRVRLAFWYTLLLAVTVLVLGFVIITASRVSVLNTIDRVLEETGHAVLDVIQIEPQTDVVTLTSDALLRTPGMWVQIWQSAADGADPLPHLLNSSYSMTGVPLALDADALNTHEPAYANVTYNGQPLRVLTIPIFANDMPFGVTQVATSITYFEQMQEFLLPIIIIAAVIAIFISLLLSVAMAAWAIRPIEKVTQAASHIFDARDLSIRLTEEDADEEMGQLIRMFNHMMERLEHVFNVQQRLINDVSHEMRTPLTSIIGHVEIMQRYGVDADLLQSIHQEADRLSRTLNELLLLVRADTGEVAVEMMPLDLDRLVLEVYEQAHYLTKGRTLKFVLEPIEIVRVYGNRERLRQMLMNLVTNAIKFTPDQGTIYVSLKVDHEQAVLEVRDTGIGISEEDQKRIYDRFFQVDQSRTHHHHQDGSGLGLSIAKWVVDIHHGQIAVQSVVGKGTTFRVTLPMMSPVISHTHEQEEDDWPAYTLKS